MADLLTHVLVPFIVLTALRWQVGFERRWIPVAMGGAAVPDLEKVGIIVDDSMIEAIVGVPFSYGPIATVAGVIVISGVIALWFDSKRCIVYGWLVLGGFLSLILDGLRGFADGFATYWLYPVWWRPPTPGLYVSSDYRVTALAIGLAVLTLAIDRYVVKTPA